MVPLWRTEDVSCEFWTYFGRLNLLHHGWRMVLYFRCVYSNLFLLSYICALPVSGAKTHMNQMFLQNEFKRIVVLKKIVIIKLWLVDSMSWCSYLPKEEAVYSYPKLLIRDTVETPIIPDNMRIANVRITMIRESLANGCLKRLWEAIWSIVAPRSPQVKKHSLAAQTQAWKGLMFWCSFIPSFEEIIMKYSYLIF